MKHLKTILAFILVLVAVITLTGCSSKPVIPNNSVPETETTPESQTPGGNTPETQTPEGNTPETQVPDTNTPETQTPGGNTPETQVPDTNTPESQTPGGNTPETQVPDTSTPEITIPERLLNKFEKFNNEVKNEEYNKEFSHQFEAFYNNKNGNIKVEEADNSEIYYFIPSKGELIKGNFINSLNYKGTRQSDIQKQVTLYDGQTKMTEEMNIIGSLGKAEEVINFKGGSFVENNTLYNFDSLNEVKESYIASPQSSLYNTRGNNDLLYKYYIDNNGQLLTLIVYDNFMKTIGIHQRIFSDNKVIEIHYSCYNYSNYIKSIGAYFDCNAYQLDVKTTSYKAGNLTVPNIDSYEFGTITKPQFWG